MPCAMPSIAVARIGGRPVSEDSSGAGPALARRHQHGVERDRREQHDRGPAQDDAVVAAHEGNQREADHRVGHQDVAEPDEQRVDEADEEQSDEAPLEQPDGIHACLQAGALDEDRKPHAKEKREEAVELAFGEESDERVRDLVEPRRGQRRFLRGGDELVAAEGVDVDDENAEHRHAADDVEDVHPLRCGDRRRCGDGRCR